MASSAFALLNSSDSSCVVQDRVGRVIEGQDDGVPPAGF